MTFCELVELKKIEMRKQNLKEIRKDIDKKETRLKINNFIKRWDNCFTYDEVRERILNDDLIAVFFAKNPTKQNVSEKLAAELLGVEILSQKSGNNCIRFDKNGDIVFKNGVAVTKAADFDINGYYATQKFTDKKGGAQDNQFKDVIDFLEKGSIKHKVMAIVDGPYWDTKINELYDEFGSNPNVKITSVMKLKEELYG